VSVAYEHPIGPTSVDDWLAQEHPADGSRLELIFGYLHVSPAPSTRHQYAGDELRAVLKDALRQAGRTDLYAVTAVGVRISTKRDTKAAVYANASVPYFWEVHEDRIGAFTLITHVLKDGQYVEDLTARPGITATINAAPVPVTFDPAVLHP
jgi:hypothetical protein